jgi:hypothetical protein
MTTTKQDFFKDARDKITIADAWSMLGLSGLPKPSCKSPFREDKSPSFSIHADGRAFKDHATGEGGDVVEFIRLAIGGDHREVREWLMERIGTTATTSKSPPITKKIIEWPADLHEGQDATWKAFSKMRGLTYPAVHSMVKTGVLRFSRINSAACYVVTDGENRAAEIRRMGGKLFGELKAYPLRGVDKTWLPGLHLLRDAPKTTAVLITEGASDLLAAFDLYSRYRREHGGRHSWQPAALLGAGCKTLCNEAFDLLRGRHVRHVPDGDAAGDAMADHWTLYLRKHGCSVDVVNLPRDTDLSDHIKTIPTTDLFSK